MEKCAACDGTGQMTKPTPRTDAKAYTPFEDDANPQIVNADFARSLERQCARQSALLREVMENDWCRREFRERIERELKG
jgi:hypothetical protein